MPIRAYQQEDQREFTLKVAGPTALLIAKSVKINERAATPNRLQPKDGLDIWRILRAVDSETMAATLHQLANDALAGETTLEALELLRDGTTGFMKVLVDLTVRATDQLEDPEFVAGSITALIENLLDGYEALG